MAANAPVTHYAGRMKNWKGYRAQRAVRRRRK